MKGVFYLVDYKKFINLEDVLSRCVLSVSPCRPANSSFHLFYWQGGGNLSGQLFGKACVFPAISFLVFRKCMCVCSLIFGPRIENGSFSRSLSLFSAHSPDKIPCGKGHSHKFKEGTIFDYAIKLYYFDFDLRNILLRYISRIEVNFRTTVVYLVSNKYKKIPCWYKDNNVVDSSLLKSRTYKNVLKNIRQEPLINRHYTKYKTGAPAWKELEFMPFGTIINLYDNLRDQHLRCDIAKVYGITNPSNFSNYINTVRPLRNCCAHGKVLFDLRLPKAISKGPLGDLKVRKTMLSGAYCVFRYFLQKISENRVIEMETRLKEAYSCIPYQSVKDIILKTSGFTEEDVL